MSQDSPDLPAWIPVARAAVILRISREKVMRRIENGRLRAYQDPDSRRWFVDASAVEAYRRVLSDIYTGPLSTQRSTD